MRTPIEIPGAISPRADGLYLPTEYTEPITEQLHMAGNGPRIRATVARDIAGPVIYGGLPNRPWDRLHESCIRNGLIESMLFVNCGNEGADEGIIWIPRQLTGWLTIRNCVFINCNSVCIYFDDIASGLYGPIVIEDCQFYNCEQALLIGGGRGFVIRDILEVGSQRPSVIDDRAQVDRSSPRSCKWVDPLGPGQPWATPWEQARHEFKQIGLPMDIPALAREFHTQGVIEQWQVKDGPPVQFLDDARQFWEV